VVRRATLHGCGRLVERRSRTVYRRHLARSQSPGRCAARLARPPETVMTASASAAEPLLKIAGVRIEAVGRAPSEPRTLLEGLSFEIGSGAMVALVGESGSGKTLAARAILGLLPPGVRQSAGRIELHGRDLTQLSAHELRKVRGAQIGMVFQEPMVSL